MSKEIQKEDVVSENDENTSKNKSIHEEQIKETVSKSPSLPNISFGDKIINKYKNLSPKEKDRYTVWACGVVIGIVLATSAMGVVQINDIKVENQRLTAEKQNISDSIEQSAQNSEKLGAKMISAALGESEFVYEMPSEDIDALVTDIIKEAGYTPSSMIVEMTEDKKAKVTVKAVGNSYDNLLALVASVNSKRYMAIDSFEAIVDGETDPKGETALKKVTTSETKTRLVPVIDEETGEVTYETEEYSVPKVEYVEIDQEESIKEIQKQLDVVFTIKMIGK